MSTQTGFSMETGDEKIAWSKREEKRFIDLMVQEVRHGNLTSTIFHERTWTVIEQQMNLEFGKVYTVKRLKEKFRRLKTKFRVFKDLITSTGMGWDEQNNTVVGSEDNWRNAIAKNKEAKQFRKKGCEHFSLLEEIFHTSTATGHFARTSTQDPLGSEQEQEVEEVYLRGPRNLQNPIGSDTFNMGADEDEVGASSQRSKKKKKGQTKSHDSSPMDEAWMAFKDTQMSKKVLYEKVSGAMQAEQCVDILESMEGVSSKQYVAAVEVFGSRPTMTSIFLRMSEMRRKEWLESLDP